MPLTKRQIAKMIYLQGPINTEARNPLSLITRPATLDVDGDSIFGNTNETIPAKVYRVIAPIGVFRYFTFYEVNDMAVGDAMVRVLRELMQQRKYQQRWLRLQMGEHSAFVADAHKRRNN